ncbi:NUDIX hydrolase [Geitlerinema sp. P-1104]|uniref:NUDIX hydrolase n=1 Tax=Geitlerinema sp. P-1104 TaxID=2546230 RepID=UPI0025701D1F|nr:NUDIX hydrolase [Geitlerinema sp. P-1104]
MLGQQVWRYIKTVMGVIFRHPITGTTVVAELIEGEDAGKLVLIQRRDTGRWGLPGGIIDWGEDIPTAARRELYEETGLQLHQLGRLVGVYSHPDRDPRIHSISIVVAAQVTGEFNPQDTQEVLGVRAFDPSEIPYDCLCHDHERQLRDYLAGKTAIA